METAVGLAVRLMFWRVVLWGLLVSVWPQMRLAGRVYQRINRLTPPPTTDRPFRFDDATVAAALAAHERELRAGRRQCH